MYDTDHWTDETHYVVNLLDTAERGVYADRALYEECKSLSVDNLRERVLRYLEEDGTALIGPENFAFIEWDAVQTYFDWPRNVIELPQRGKTVEEIAQEVLSQGLSASEAIARVVEAHGEAIDVVVGILEQQEAKIERLTQQMRTMIEVHGT